MHKALILAPEHADDALATIGRMAELCEEQSEMCRLLSEELDLTGEIPMRQLRKLATLQIEALRLRRHLRNLTTTDRS
jgi:hypothetical protein